MLQVDSSFTAIAYYFVHATTALISIAFYSNGQLLCLPDRINKLAAQSLLLSVSK